MSKQSKNELRIMRQMDRLTRHLGSIDFTYPPLLSEDRIDNLCRAWHPCDCDDHLCWTDFVEIILPFPPKAHQSYRRGKKGGGYVPPEVVEYKEKIAVEALHALEERDHKWPRDRIYRFSMKAFFYKNEGDVENYVKPIKDALEKILYHNDRQVQVHGDPAKFKVKKGWEHVMILVEALT